jgi:hypothetical protein
VAVDDARAGTFEDPGFGADGWFSPVGFVFCDELGGHADLVGEIVDFLEGGHLGGVLRDDPFPRITMRYRVCFAEVVEHIFAFEAEFCF